MESVCPVLLAMLLSLPGLAAQNDTNCTDDVCLTEECISLAHEMITSMDESTDPCQNFYQYACGGWIQNQFLPSDKYYRTNMHSERSFVSVRKMLAVAPKRTDLNAVKKAKDMYKSCVLYAQSATNYRDIVSVVNTTFGRWPLTCHNCTTEGFDLETFLFKAIQLGVQPLFKLSVPSNQFARLNLGDSGKRNLVVNVPELWLPVEEYLRQSQKQVFQQTYSKTIYKTAKDFGVENYRKAIKDAKEIVKVETALANMHNIGITQQQSLSLGAFNNSYGKLLNWTSFLSRFESFQDTSRNLSIHDKNPDYLHNMTEYFSRLPARTQANYIIWRVIDSLTSILIEEHTKLEIIAWKYVTGHYREPTPEESCAKYTSKVFPLSVHRMLYNEHLPGNKLDSMNVMIQSLHREFNELLDDHVLVNLTDLEIIREKNNAMKTVLAFHLHAMNDSFLENYYSNVTTVGRNFIRNVIAKRKDTFDKEFNLPLDYHNFEVTNPPYQFDAEYMGLFNTIEFNAALAQPPHWIDNVPALMNFARFGFLIGHELIHGAVNGFMLDKNGQYGKWWYNETEEYFYYRYLCLVVQYSSFLYTPAGQYINGFLTLFENIADNAGLKLAYRAYMNYTQSGVAKQQKMPGLHFSDEQIFFLAFAQLHCTYGTLAYALYMTTDKHSPYEFRANGTLQNSQEFANAFNCPVGSPMNPANKCDPW